MGAVPWQSRRSAVVKDDGRDTFLIAANLLVAPIMAALGRRIGLRSEADVLERMQQDALRMQAKGYEVVSADRYAIPCVLRRGGPCRT